MPKSPVAAAADDIQNAVRPTLETHGFRLRARTFHRQTADGLTQLINFQLGPYEPPGTYEIPAFRENLYGRFTVNLGVSVPEVARELGVGKPVKIPKDADCCIRVRLAAAAGEPVDRWWPVRPEPAIIDDIRRRLETSGLGFLEKFSTRDRIIAEWSGQPAVWNLGGARRIIMALMLRERGNSEMARALFEAHLAAPGNSSHADYVRRLASRLGLTLAPSDSTN